ncbi:hypothetical protein GQ600_11040 [Phytophthora cactorum]|nr:hypothetical protein GQ600_11040 [Phytophthora cactorum]
MFRDDPARAYRLIETLRTVNNNLPYRLVRRVDHHSRTGLQGRYIANYHLKKCVSLDSGVVRVNEASTRRNTATGSRWLCSNVHRC